LDDSTPYVIEKKVLSVVQKEIKSFGEKERNVFMKSLSKTGKAWVEDRVFRDFLGAIHIGSSATLLRYMKEQRIFSDNPKTSAEMALQRGGNDSQRNIQRELRVGIDTGLILGDSRSGYYLPDWLRNMDVGEIIKQNPELDIPEPSEGQIKAVAARISNMTEKPPVPDTLAAAFEKEWQTSELDADQFLSALSPTLGLETVLDHDKPIFVFSEKVTFDNNLVKCLPKLIEKGVKVAVIAKTDREKALIDKLNEGKTENKKILQADTIYGIKQAAAKAKVSAPRFYYFRIKDSVDPILKGRNITMYELTPDMVKRIIDAIGTACRIEPEKLPLLHEMARKFAEAA